MLVSCRAEAQPALLPEEIFAVTHWIREQVDATARVDTAEEINLWLCREWNLNSAVHKM